MNVLSLFDGMSCGQIALNRAKIPITSYHASEVDKYAIKVTQANHPETKQLGCVAEWREWDLPEIDLIMGGSPCQGFSFAGKQLNFDDPRSKLFFEFVDILNHHKPKYFLLENVKMKKEYQDIISRLLGVEPIEINSSLVSAQNRRRLYWTNIPGIEQPEDKGILLKDIIENNACEISAKVPNNYSQPILKRNYLQYFISDKAHGSQDQRVYYLWGKHGTLSAGCSNKSKILLSEFVDRDKSHCLDANYFKGGNLKSYFEKHRRQLVFSKDGLCHVGDADLKGNDSIKRVYSVEGKSPTLTTMGGGHREPKISLPELKYRKLTPLECERLQTLDDNYTNHVSNTQRYKMIGNGWTVDVIAHIFKAMKADIMQSDT